jgi:hypothetical protein
MRARFGERRANQVGRKSVTFEARVGQRVDEGDQPWAATVFGEAGDLPVDADLEARPVRLVNDANVRAGSAGHALILATGECLRQPRPP